MRKFTIVLIAVLATIILTGCPASATPDPDLYADEQEVKSLGVISVNSLGLYDMSGNVWEWCFTESTTGTYRRKRGSSWGSPFHAPHLPVAFISGEY